MYWPEGKVRAGHARLFIQSMIVRRSRRTSFPASAGNDILRISDKYFSGAKVRDIRPQTKTPRNDVSVFSRGIVLPEVQAYDCAGIEWFAWITDLVWVRIILARIAETSGATNVGPSPSLSVELCASTSPPTHRGNTSAAVRSGGSWKSRRTSPSARVAINSQAARKSLFLAWANQG